MNASCDYEELEQLLLDYVERYGLTDNARRYYLSRSPIEAFDKQSKQMPRNAHREREEFEN